MTKDKPEELYSTNHVAKVMSVHIDTVRNWIKAGKLPAHLVNGRHKIKRSDFVNFVNDRHGD